MINEIMLKPTPSGFGKYVYCGAKLFLDNNPKLDGFRNAFRYSYDQSEKSKALAEGKVNEPKCIDWIMSSYHKTGSILLDGTGKDNRQVFNAKIHPLKENLQCRPDLIIKDIGQTILYEFKSVSEIHYLYNPGYDYMHAQVWCYRFIEDFKIDRYYLFRYFKDPFTLGAFPRRTELHNTELSDRKFFPLFERYLDAIKTINSIRTAPNRSYPSNIIDKFNAPINAPEKCHNCIYYGKYCDPKCKPRQ
jgi:hypothetical protein